MIRLNIENNNAEKFYYKSCVFLTICTYNWFYFSVVLLFVLISFMVYYSFYKSFYIMDFFLINPMQFVYKHVCSQNVIEIIKHGISDGNLFKKIIKKGGGGL